MNCFDAKSNSTFDGVKFVHVILLVVFISLLIFGSRDIPDVTFETGII
ncbi:hypothetical protein [Paenisporosarcina sp. NPDC076898]